MFRRPVVLFIALLLIFSVVSCSDKKPVETNDSSSQSDGNTESSSIQSDGSDTIAEDETESSVTEAQTESVPGSPVNWPAEMLPEGFPDFGAVSSVIDFRAFTQNVNIYWNKATQDEVNIIVDKLNEYLDYDSEWQDYFYSDGIKYKQGTEEEFLKIVIQYNADAAGTDEDPQFSLEIYGEGIPK